MSKMVSNVVQRARGALIALEGCDRMGKTSQADRLVELLRDMGRKAEVQRFPDRSTVVGKTINGYLSGCSSSGDAPAVELSDEAIHLLFSANRWELAGNLRSRLEEGVDVIVDRYSYSGVAYSVAKCTISATHCAQGLSFDWCAAPEIGLPQPDRIYYLRAPDSLASLQSRSGFGVERYERVELQQRVHEVYERMQKDDVWLVVDADGTIDQVAATIAGDVKTVVSDVAHKPIAVIGQIKVKA